MTMANPFLDFLEDEPKAAYFGRQNQFGGGQRQRDFYQNAFSQIYNNYLGNLGRQALGGSQPTGSFNDYLGGLDFDSYYRQQQSYQERNPNFNAFVPRTRWAVQGRPS